MPPIRRELSEYARACEHHIADDFPFTQEELQWIGYYATEVANLADQRVLVSRPDVSRTPYHRRVCCHIQGASPRRWTIGKGGGSYTPLDLGGHEGNPVPK